MANTITKVRLLAVPLENDYQHTLYFADRETQANYFISRTEFNREDFSYQRKDKCIRYPEHIDRLQGCNYVMYQNTAYSGKWFYAFITRMDYINDERTDIYIETDVMQTWLTDYYVNTSFIEREHVDSDQVGEHTVPEQLETGDYVINVKNKNDRLVPRSLILGVTVDINDLEDTLIGNGKFAPVAGNTYNGIYSGVKYYKVGVIELNGALRKLADAGQSDAVVAIFTCPSNFVEATKNHNYAEVNASDSAKREEWGNTQNYKPTNLNGYVPKNNKLFTYPYCYMLMSNNCGGSAVYKYELFNDPTNSEMCQFYIYSAITPSMSICISPRHYNGVEINSLERLNLGKFPVCAWATDVYTNWLTQNGVNIPLSIGTAVATTAIAVGGAVLAPATGGASAIATAGAIGAGVGGVASVAGTVGEIYQHSLQPPQAEGNINSGDVTFATDTLTFTAYQMTIKKEYARIIDNYFTMYGYKVNRVGRPSIMHRENYWYIKTIDANIDGNIPNDDLMKIKACYNKGITFWCNPNSIGDYSVSNNVCG